MSKRIDFMELLEKLYNNEFDFIKEVVLDEEYEIYNSTKTRNYSSQYLEYVKLSNLIGHEDNSRNHFHRILFIIARAYDKYEISKFLEDYVEWEEIYKIVQPINYKDHNPEEYREGYMNLYKCYHKIGMEDVDFLSVEYNVFPLYPRLVKHNVKLDDYLEEMLINAMIFDNLYNETKDLSIIKDLVDDGFNLPLICINWENKTPNLNKLYILSSCENFDDFISLNKESILKYIDGKNEGGRYLLSLL